MSDAGTVELAPGIVYRVALTGTATAPALLVPALSNVQSYEVIIVCHGGVAGAAPHAHVLFGPDANMPLATLTNAWPLTSGQTVKIKITPATRWVSAIQGASGSTEMFWYVPGRYV